MQNCSWQYYSLSFCHNHHGRCSRHSHGGSKNHSWWLCHTHAIAYSPSSCWQLLEFLSLSGRRSWSWVSCNVYPYSQILNRTRYISLEEILWISSSERGASEDDTKGEDGAGLEHSASRSGKHHIWKTPKPADYHWLLKLGYFLMFREAKFPLACSDMSIELWKIF